MPAGREVYSFALNIFVCQGIKILVYIKLRLVFPPAGGQISQTKMGIVQTAIDPGENRSLRPLLFSLKLT
jgi:hypothetical protein